MTVAHWSAASSSQRDSDRRRPGGGGRPTRGKMEPPSLSNSADQSLRSRLMAMGAGGGGAASAPGSSSALMSKFKRQRGYVDSDNEDVTDPTPTRSNIGSSPGRNPPRPTGGGGGVNPYANIMRGYEGSPGSPSTPRTRSYSTSSEDGEGVGGGSRRRRAASKTNDGPSLTSGSRSSRTTDKYRPPPGAVPASTPGATMGGTHHGSMASTSKHALDKTMHTYAQTAETAPSYAAGTSTGRYGRAGSFASKQSKNPLDRTNHTLVSLSTAWTTLFSMGQGIIPVRARPAGHQQQMEQEQEVLIENQGGGHGPLHLQGQSEHGASLSRPSGVTPATNYNPPGGRMTPAVSQAIGAIDNTTIGETTNTRTRSSSTRRSSRMKQGQQEQPSPPRPRLPIRRTEASTAAQPQIQALYPQQALQGLPSKQQAQQPPPPPPPPQQKKLESSLAAAAIAKTLENQESSRPPIRQQGQQGQTGTLAVMPPPSSSVAKSAAKSGGRSERDSSRQRRREDEERRKAQSQQQQQQQQRPPSRASSRPTSKATATVPSSSRPPTATTTTVAAMTTTALHQPPVVVARPRYPPTSSLPPHASPNPYVVLTLSCLVCISSLAVASPYPCGSRGTVERLVLALLGISGALSSLTYCGLRYGPSRLWLVRSRTWEVRVPPPRKRGRPVTVSKDDVRNFDFKSAIKMISVLQLALWTAIGATVLFAGNELAVAGGVEVWNSNLYFGTWVGYGVASYVFADGCIVPSFAGAAQPSPSSPAAAPSSNPKVRIRNDISRTWILVIMYSVVLAASSMVLLLGGSLCSSSVGSYDMMLGGGPSAICSRLAIGIVIGVVGALLSVLYWSARFLRAHFRRRAPPSARQRILVWNTRVDQASCALSAFCVVSFAVNAGLLTTPTSGGVGSEPCNVYFSSWICFGLSLYLALRHVDVWSAQPWVRRDASSIPPPRPAQAVLPPQGSMYEVPSVSKIHRLSTHGTDEESEATSQSSYSFEYDEEAARSDDDDDGGAAGPPTLSESGSGTRSSGHSGPPTMSDDDSEPTPPKLQYQPVQQYSAGMYGRMPSGLRVSAANAAPPPKQYGRMPTGLRASETPKPPPDQFGRMPSGLRASAANLAPNRSDQFGRMPSGLRASAVPPPEQPSRMPSGLRATMVMKASKRPDPDVISPITSPQESSSQRRRTPQSSEPIAKSSSHGASIKTDPAAGKVAPGPRQQQKSPAPPSRTAQQKQPPPSGQEPSSKQSPLRARPPASSSHQGSGKTKPVKRTQEKSTHSKISSAHSSKRKLEPEETSKTSSGRRRKPIESRPSTWTMGSVLPPDRASTAQASRQTSPQPPRTIPVQQPSQQRPAPPPRRLQTVESGRSLETFDSQRLPKRVSRDTMATIRRAESLQREEEELLGKVQASSTHDSSRGSGRERRESLWAGPIGTAAQPQPKPKPQPPQRTQSQLAPPSRGLPRAHSEMIGLGRSKSERSDPISQEPSMPMPIIEEPRESSFQDIGMGSESSATLWVHAGKGDAGSMVSSLPGISEHSSDESIELWEGEIPSVPEMGGQQKSAPKRQDSEEDEDAFVISEQAIPSLDMSTGSRSSATKPPKLRGSATSKSLRGSAASKSLLGSAASKSLRGSAASKSLLGSAASKSLRGSASSKSLRGSADGKSEGERLVSRVPPLQTSPARPGRVRDDMVESVSSSGESSDLSAGPPTVASELSQGQGPPTISDDSRSSARRKAGEARRPRRTSSDAEGGVGRMGSTIITGSEQERLLGELKKQTTPPTSEAAAQPAKKSKFFEQFDKNGDGFIDKSEMREMFRVKLGKNLSDQETDRVFGLLDRDGDGVIDLAEFEDWCIANFSRHGRSIGDKAGGKPPAPKPSRKPPPESLRDSSQLLESSDEDKLSPLSDLSDSPNAKSEGVRKSSSSSKGTYSQGSPFHSSSPSTKEGIKRSSSESALSRPHRDSTGSVLSSQTIPNDQKLTVDQMVAAALKQAQELKQTHDALRSSSSSPQTSEAEASSPKSQETSDHFKKSPEQMVAAALKQAKELKQSHDAAMQESSPETSDDDDDEDDDEEQDTRESAYKTSPIKSSSDENKSSPESEKKTSPSSGSAEGRTASLNSGDAIVDEMVMEALKYAQDAKENSGHSAATTGNIPSSSFHSTRSGGGVSIHSYYSNSQDRGSSDEQGAPWYAC